MVQKLTVLLLEDNEDDAHLIMHEMEQSGFSTQWRRAVNEAEYRDALSPDLDLVLADYNLPQFTGLEALKIVQERNQDIPFIVITGSIEEAALECIKAGATDYLLKDRLSRLGDAVRRALAEKQLRLEKAKALADLQESEARFRRLAENAPDIIYRIELQPEPTLQFVSQKVLDVTGYSPAELYKDPTLFRRMLHPDDLPSWEKFVESKLYESTMESRIIDRDGTMHWIQTRTVPVYDEENRLIAFEGIGRDITEKMVMAQAEREQRQLAEALRDTANILNSTLALQEVFDAILKNVDRVVPHDGANIMLIEGEKASVVACYGYYQDENLKDLVMAVSFVVEETPNLRAMVHRKRPYVVSNTNEEPAWRVLPATDWVRSHISAPIRQEGEVIGFLNLDSQTPGFFDETFADRLLAVADQLSIAVRNAQLYEAEQRQRRIEETLRRAAAVLNESLHLDEVFTRILDQVNRAIDFDSGSVLQKDGDQLVLKAGRGFQNGERLLEIKIPTTPDYPNGEVLASEKPLMIADVAKRYAGFNKLIDRYQTKQIHSWLGVPMVVQGQVIGMITLDRHEIRPFTNEEIKLASAFANHAATALQNARLYKELEFYNEQLEQAVLERTEEMRQALQRAETILQNSPDAVLLLADNGQIETSNPAFAELFGYQFEEVHGWIPTSFIEPEYQLAMLSLLDSTKQQRRTEWTQLVARHKNGSKFDVEIALSPITTQDGIGGIVCAMRDISALKEVERMKDAFIANVSHELRTPITNLRLHSDLLQRNPSKQSKYTECIQREAVRLSSIVESLLRLARLEQGVVALKQSTFPLNLMVQEYTLDRQTLAEQKNLTLKLELGINLQPIQADRGLIGQALSILLTNAINYTPPGGTVTVATRQFTENGRQWQEFSVADTGPGITQEDRRNLFIRFYRGEAGRSSGEPGTGLGLAIVKEIVDQHQGEIQVLSDIEQKQGATFIVRLPA